VALQGLIVAGRVQCPGSFQRHSRSDRLTASMHNRFLLFATKRLLFTIPQLFAVSVIVFFLIRLLPGDPSYMLAGPYASPDRIVEVRGQLGLDQPLVTQYFNYLARIFAGDFGIRSEVDVYLEGTTPVITGGPAQKDIIPILALSPK